MGNTNEASVRRQSDYDPVEFLARHVSGDEPIPVADCLTLFGLDATVDDGHLRVSRVPGSSAAEDDRIEGLLGRSDR